MSRWSQLKIRIEDLFVPSLNLRLDHDMVLRIGPRSDANIVWRYCPPWQCHPDWWYNLDVMEQYKNRALKDIFEPFDLDKHHLGDVLRACDRRIGRRSLLMWSFFLDGDNPARTILRHRLG